MAARKKGARICPNLRDFFRSPRFSSVPPLLTGSAVLLSFHPYRSGEHHRCLRCGSDGTVHVLSGTVSVGHSAGPALVRWSGSGLNPLLLSYAQKSAVFTVEIKKFFCFIYPCLLRGGFYSGFHIFFAEMISFQGGYDNHLFLNSYVAKE